MFVFLLLVRRRLLWRKEMTRKRSTNSRRLCTVAIVPLAVRACSTRKDRTPVSILSCYIGTYVTLLPLTAYIILLLLRIHGYGSKSWTLFGTAPGRRRPCGFADLDLNTLGWTLLLITRTARAILRRGFARRCCVMYSETSKVGTIRIFDDSKEYLRPRISTQVHAIFSTTRIFFSPPTPTRVVEISLYYHYHQYTGVYTSRRRVECCCSRYLWQCGGCTAGSVLNKTWRRRRSCGDGGWGWGEKLIDKFVRFRNEF